MPAINSFSSDIGTCWTLNGFTSKTSQTPIDSLDITTFGSAGWNEFFTAVWGDDRNIWTPSADGNLYAFRFPHPLETLTGAISPPTSATVMPANARFLWNRTATVYTQSVLSINTSNTTTPVRYNTNISHFYGAGQNFYAFATPYSFYTWNANAADGTALGFGWLEDPQYTGTNAPLNCFVFGRKTLASTWFVKPTAVNSSTASIVRSTAAEFTPTNSLANTTDFPWLDQTTLLYCGRLPGFLQRRHYYVSGSAGSPGINVVYHLPNIRGRTNPYYMRISTPFSNPQTVLLLPVYVQTP